MTEEWRQVLLNPIVGFAMGVLLGIIILAIIWLVDRLRGNNW